MRAVVLALALATMSQAQPTRYIVEKRTADGAELYILRDTATVTEVHVVPALGNNSVAMLVKGKNIFWFPGPTLAAALAKPSFSGNPLLWPWANRIDGDAYWVNGKKFLLNPDLGNYRKDPNKQPIHGLLSYAKEWKVTRAVSTDKEAVVTSRIEFWRYPQWMAQFPFAHNIEMTYRLSEGVLEVETSIENLSTEAMPVSLGYHPYFQLHDSARDEWKVRLPAREKVALSPTLVPTGERVPNPYTGEVALKGISLDDVFTGLPQPAVFAVEGKQQKIEVEYGPKYLVAVVYAPPGRGFICFEPMTGITNAFNAAQKGQYPELQSVAPGATWRETFRIRPSGF
jgi:aldose 1-epimerase